MWRVEGRFPSRTDGGWSGDPRGKERLRRPRTQTTGKERNGRISTCLRPGPRGPKDTGGPLRYDPFRLTGKGTVRPRTPTVPLVSKGTWTGKWDSRNDKSTRDCGRVIHVGSTLRVKEDRPPWASVEDESPREQTTGTRKDHDNWKDTQTKFRERTIYRRKTMTILTQI